MTTQEIQTKFAYFMQERTSANDRYSSFDLCYAYFYNNRGNLLGNNLEMSCLCLWSFLGSWGMIARGNALQQKSYAYLIPVIEFINNNPQYFDLKIDDKNYAKLIWELYNGLKAVLGLSQKHQKTVITKIILGVYGCFPAFDSRVSETFKSSTGNLSKKDIDKVIDFYLTHKQLIDSLAQAVVTIAFPGNRTAKILVYTAAKIIDMIAFVRP